MRLGWRLPPTDLTTRVRAKLSCTIQSLTRCSLGRQKPRHKLAKASKASGALRKGFRHSWIQAPRSDLGGQPGVSSRRQTQGLPARASSLTLAECLQCFVGAIFYVGKGTRARPDAHLWEALGYREHPGKNACSKVRRILDIWASGRGVLSLHCFQHTVAMEAYTREACLLDALGIQTLTNQKQGHYYGEAAYWPPTKRRHLGVYLLHCALLVFLAEGEGELRPQDIQARG
ncbi:ankyrin repeat and LEM domain-containing protein 1-like [Chionomys nivalis]|uniref:ankyrin repeat and LEM domain-containing protein 1-like n=1 Tax=Chionomys nivalis TaxID=269649 RepID=UPI0025925573|nr:ankyrin repeat and LEM domain-containing protein 1-like [Chionomys nivalis]